MENIELKLSKKQYLSLVKLLFFADYCNMTWLSWYLKNINEESSIYNLLEIIYWASSKINIEKDIHILTKAPFTHKDFQSYKNSIEDDFRNISNYYFAKEFAKRDLNWILLNENKFTLHTETFSEINERLISNKMSKYIKEFSNNWIKNLRFKMFYNISEDDENEE